MGFVLEVEGGAYRGDPSPLRISNSHSLGCVGGTSSEFEVVHMAAATWFSVWLHHPVRDLFFPVGIFLSKGFSQTSGTERILGTLAELERSSLLPGKKDFGSLRSNSGMGTGGAGSP